MDIFFSILYIISLLSCVASIILIKKSEQKLNLATENVISILIFMGFEAVLALFYSYIQIKINLLSLSIGNFIMFFILGYFIFINGKKQELYIDKVDYFIHFFITLVVFLISRHIFHGFTIGYNSGDPASHFIHAMNIVRTGNISAMHFSPLMNAIAISLCKPFLNWNEYYKGLILGDTAIFLLLQLVTYIIISNVMKQKKDKIVALIITLFCMAGYPLNSYLVGGYIWLTAGMLVFCFSIYSLDSYFKGIYNRKFINLMLIGGLSVLSWTYILYTVYASLTIFLAMLIVVIQKEKGHFVKEAIHKLSFFVIPGILFVTTFIKYWKGVDSIIFMISSLFRTTGIDGTLAKPVEAVQSAVDAVMSNGYEYSRLYSDFLIFLPVIIGLIAYCIKERQIKLYIMLASILLVGVVISFVLCKEGYFSGYYYYKLYYILWILSWFCVGEAYYLFKDYTILILSYALTFLILFCTSTFQIEQRIYDQIPVINHAEGNVPELFLYMKNYETMRRNYDTWWISDDKFQLFSYDISYNEDTYDSEMLFDTQCVDDFLTMRWYLGFSGKESARYCMLSAQDAILSAKDNGVNHIIVLNTNGYYDTNIGVFGEYPTVYQNDAGVILEIGEY